MPITVTPRDNGLALNNPGMGWILYYYDHHLRRYGATLPAHDTVDDFPGIAVVYMAVPWAFLEPREGVFNWALVDAPAQRWIDKGRKIALRFPCCEPFYDYAAPRWAQAAGVPFHPFKPTERTRHWIKQSLGADVPETCFAPDYADPQFLRFHAAFLAEAARHYEGNPNVAFIDVGSFGTWGEGHTALSCGRHYAPDVKLEHLELYRAAFPRTLLVAGDDLLKIDGRDHPALIRRAAELGMALRDDSVLVDTLSRLAESEDMAKSFWPTVPVILEPAHYGQAKTVWKTWGDGTPYLESIERYHASYAGVHGWPREFLDENRASIDAINRRLGYRIQLTRLSWPRRVAVGVPWTAVFHWRNGGVAPCLPGGHPALTLKDRQGGITGVLTAPDFDVRNLPVGAPGKAVECAHAAAFTLPAFPPIPPGQHELFVSVGWRDGTPRLALPLAGDDGHRRYRMGAIEVAPPHA